MKNTNNRTTRAPVMNAIQTALRNLLAIELEHLQQNPDEETQEILDSIDQLTSARSDPNSYDELFNEHLLSLPPDDGQDLSPAALGRLYSAWHDSQTWLLEQMNRSLTKTTAKAAETQMRAALEECLQTVMTTSSAYGHTVTEELELMNPAAADTSRPVIMYGPNGLKATVEHWYHILHLPLQHLAERGAISRALCPVRLPGARHPVLEIAQDDADTDARPFSKRARSLPGAFTLWVHHSTPHICRITAETLRALGQNPRNYTVQYHPKDSAACDQIPAGLTPLSRDTPEPPVESSKLPEPEPAGQAA